MQKTQFATILEHKKTPVRIAANRSLNKQINYGKYIRLFHLLFPTGGLILLGRGELTLRACPVFIADSFDPSQIADPAYCAYCEGTTVVCSDPNMAVPVVADGYELG